MHVDKEEETLHAKREKYRTRTAERDALAKKIVSVGGKQKVRSDKRVGETFLICIFFTLVALVFVQSSAYVIRLRVSYNPE